jgi:radical S-adenosyl methionine domain-containing protein 2
MIGPSSIPLSDHALLRPIQVPDLGVVNLHYTFFCNYKCTFCHSHFFDSRTGSKISLEIWSHIISLLKPYCKRINFAGGEPLFHPHEVGELIKATDASGLIATIITNGKYLTEDWLENYGPHLRAIGISCDSAIEATQKELKRGNGRHVTETLDRFRMIHAFNGKGGNILPKINTVVTNLNWEEDMRDFVIRTGARRWKIFQILPIMGENGSSWQNLLISEEKFKAFCDRHSHLNAHGIEVVPETNTELIDTYIMVDPEGRFFSNRGNRYTYSDPIHLVGVEEGLRQIGFQAENLNGINRMFL